MCVFALIVTCLAGKLRKTDFPSLNPDEFGAGDAWADDQWGDEDWPSEPYHKPEWPSESYHKPEWPSESYHKPEWPSETHHKPLKGWDEPLVVEKKVPVYVPGT